MKITDLNIEVGTKINLFIKVCEDGSGKSMGTGVEGKPEYLTQVIYNGPIYNGTMGQANLLNGEPVGLPISACDILAANPEYNK
jgi:hypothetical protein